MVSLERAWKEPKSDIIETGNNNKREKRRKKSLENAVEFELAAKTVGFD